MVQGTRMAVKVVGLMVAIMVVLGVDAKYNTQGMVWQDGRMVVAVYLLGVLWWVGERVGQWEAIGGVLVGVQLFGDVFLRYYFSNESNWWVDEREKDKIFDDVVRLLIKLAIYAIIGVLYYELILCFNENKTKLKNLNEKITILLQNFPTGIIIYNKHEGIKFVNNSWINTQTTFLENSLLMEKQKDFLNRNNHIDSIMNIPQENGILKDKKLDTLNCLDLLKNKSKDKYSLKDILDRVHSQVYGHSHKTFDDFQDYKNEIDFCLSEYDIKNKDNMVIKEFDVKFITNEALFEDKTIMLVLNDVGELIERGQSKISEKIKTIMFWSLSHELRTPLNHINGVFSLMKNKFETPEQQYLLTVAESSIELLSLKIDDILDFYEVETDNFNPEKVKFDIRNQWNALETLFISLIDKSQIKLCFFVHENTPKYLVHDASRIHKILVNLISNSVKYTNNGVISVVIDWIPKHCDAFGISSGTVRYSVSDSGQGISQMKRKRIFKFLNPQNDQHDVSHNHQTTSLAGTGLSISQKIANKLNSKIEFISSIDVGSKFWFELEIDQADNLKSEERIMKIQDHEFDKKIKQRSKSIMIFEGEEINIEQHRRKISQDYSYEASKYESIKDNKKYIEFNNLEDKNSYSSRRLIRKFRSNFTENQPLAPEYKFSNMDIIDESLISYDISESFVTENPIKHFIRAFNVQASSMDLKKRLTVLNSPVRNIEEDHRRAPRLLKSIMKKEEVK